MRGLSLRTLILALAVVIGAALLLRWYAAAPVDRPSDPAGAGAAAPAPAAAPPDPALAAPAPEPAEAPPDSDAGPPTSAWESVDLEEIRRALPNNSYWQTAVPTQDERVLRDREDERARWNVEYGKVLSGNASEAEIHAYYAHRQRLSADYVEFTSYLLDQLGDELSEQDVALLELARRLHLARLEEYPRQTQAALERKQEQDRAREAWLADEAEFGARPPQ